MISSLYWSSPLSIISKESQVQQGPATQAGVRSQPCHLWEARQGRPWRTCTGEKYCPDIIAKTWHFWLDLQYSDTILWMSRWRQRHCSCTRTTWPKWQCLCDRQPCLYLIAYRHMYQSGNAFVIGNLAYAWLPIDISIKVAMPVISNHAYTLLPIGT